MKKLLSIFAFLLATSGLALSPDLAWKKVLKKYALPSADQAFCTDLGGSVQGANLDKPMNPASVTKLFISWWALKELGGHFQFETKVFYDEETRSLHLQGAGDPFFVSENIFYLLNLLNERGITELNEVTFDANFSFNWSTDIDEIRQELFFYFNTSAWDQLMESSFQDLITLLDQNNMPLVLRRPKMKVLRVAFEEQPSAEAEVVENIKSAPLYRQLKQMNQYSNNFMAQRYFENLGESEALEVFLKEHAGITKEQAYFFNGSGLDHNYTTCRATLLMLRKLYQEIDFQKILPQEVIAVPAVDSGTLVQRFTEPKYRNTLLAKTGTLSIACTLAGSLLKDGEHSFFAVFNSKSTPQKSRAFQDELIKSIFIPDSNFEYSPTPYFSFDF